jgi:hypothetical protein
LLDFLERNVLVRRVVRMTSQIRSLLLLLLSRLLSRLLLLLLLLHPSRLLLPLLLLHLLLLLLEQTHSSLLPKSLHPLPAAMQLR